MRSALRGALVLALLAGCTPLRKVVVVERDVLQAAVVPPPSGPVATGPLAPPGGPAVDLELSGHLPGGGGVPAEGPSGHHVPALAGRLRLSGRLFPALEGGVGLEFIPSEPGWTADEAPALAAPEVSMLIRGGPQLRASIPVSRRVSFDMQGDLRLGRVLVARHIEVHETTLVYDASGVEVSERWTIDDEQWTPVLVQPRFGLGMGAKVSDRVHLDGGLLLQTAASVPGHQRDEWRCEYTYEDPDSLCAGPAMPPVLESALVGTVWLGLGLKVGPTWLLPAAWWHAVPDHGVPTLAPVGGALAWRIPLVPSAAERAAAEKASAEKAAAEKASAEPAAGDPAGAGRLSEWDWSPPPPPPPGQPARPSYRDVAPVARPYLYALPAEGSPAAPPAPEDPDAPAPPADPAAPEAPAPEAQDPGVHAPAP